MNIFPKAYFVDFSVQNLSEIMVNIGLMARNDIAIIRHHDEYCNDNIKQVINFAKIKGIKVFSHFKNNLKKNVHFASSKRKSIFSGDVTISFHEFKDFQRLQIFKPNAVFLSPVFKTQTHPNSKPFGKIQTFKLVAKIKKLAPMTDIFLLGGMTQKRFAQLKRLDFQKRISGFAGIRNIF